jgi:hypothetical protein
MSISIFHHTTTCTPRTLFTPPLFPRCIIAAKQISFFAKIAAICRCFLLMNINSLLESPSLTCPLVVLSVAAPPSCLRARTPATIICDNSPRINFLKDEVLPLLEERENNITCRSNKKDDLKFHFYFLCFGLFLHFRINVASTKMTLVFVFFPFFRALSSSNLECECAEMCHPFLAVDSSIVDTMMKRMLPMSDQVIYVS